MLRDSHLRCPIDGKRMAIDEIQEEGQHLVWHECLHCLHRELAPAQRPQRTASPWLTDLRRRVWEEAIP